MAGKTRSPNYPALGLPQALEAARKVWNREKRTAISNDTAATAFGFKSLSGPARVTIGALRQYGLIEKADKGHLRLSNLAVNALHGTPEERQTALRRAAGNPLLFRELAQTHADASDEAIRSYLLTRKGFVDDGARKAIRAFRDTVKLAKPETSGYTADDEQQEPEDMTDQQQSSNAGIAQGTGKPNVRVLTWALSNNTSAELRLIGETTPEDLELLEEYVKMTKRALTREQKQ